MSHTILIGAKDSNIAYLLQRYAEESGFQTAPICQFDDLLDRVHHLNPTVIILDIDFIETADWAVVRRLITQPVAQHLPIIVYSCLNEPPDDWREGADGFLLKSALYDDFVSVIKRATSTHDADETQPVDEQAGLADAVIADDQVERITRPANEH